MNTFNEGGLPTVTDWSGQGGGVKVSLSSNLTKPYQYMFHKVTLTKPYQYMFHKVTLTKPYQYMFHKVK